MHGGWIHQVQEAECFMISIVVKKCYLLKKREIKEHDDYIIAHTTTQHSIAIFVCTISILYVRTITICM